MFENYSYFANSEAGRRIVVNDLYPDLDKFSKTTGIPPDKLVKAFEIEKVFHKKILKEESFEKRQEMYRNVYNTVHPIYGTNKTDIHQGKNPKDKTVQLFRKELEGKSILDVGCGEGHFLASIARQLKYESLVGIDVSIPPLSKFHQEIEFLSLNIIGFDIGRQFDVVFTDQVLEHIAPADLTMHLSSIRSALKSEGLLIVNFPHRDFGPSDVTRIIDFSYKGKVKAQGTHLNESTYGEIIPVLEKNGFQHFRTVLPIPKVKYFLKSFRMRASLMQLIENNPIILNVLHSICIRRQCVTRLGVTLICNKC